MGSFYYQENAVFSDLARNIKNLNSHKVQKLLSWEGVILCGAVRLPFSHTADLVEFILVVGHILCSCFKTVHCQNAPCYKSLFFLSKWCISALFAFQDLPGLSAVVCSFFFFNFLSVNHFSCFMNQKMCQCERQRPANFTLLLLPACLSLSNTFFVVI